MEIFVLSKYGTKSKKKYKEMEVFVYILSSILHR